MTSLQNAPTTAVRRRRTLSAEALDEICEALISAPHPLARSEVVCELVQEIYDSVAWLQTDVVDDELIGLRAVLESAREHHARLAHIRWARTPALDGGNA